MTDPARTAHLDQELSCINDIINDLTSDIRGVLQAGCTNIEALAALTDMFDNGKDERALAMLAAGALLHIAQQT